MLYRLACHSFFCLLDGYSDYNQIVVTLKDQVKNNFTCPCRTFAFERMSLRLCDTPSTFQHCIMAIFLNMIEKHLEIFTNDFLVFGDSFEECLHHLSLVLMRCEKLI